MKNIDPIKYTEYYEIYLHADSATSKLLKEKLELDDVVLSSSINLDYPGYVGVAMQHEGLDHLRELLIPKDEIALICGSSGLTTEEILDMPEDKDYI